MKTIAIKYSMLSQMYGTGLKCSKIMCQNARAPKGFRHGIILKQDSKSVFFFVRYDFDGVSDTMSVSENRGYLSSLGQDTLEFGPVYIEK